MLPHGIHACMSSIITVRLLNICGLLLVVFNNFYKMHLLDVIYYGYPLIYLLGGIKNVTFFPLVTSNYLDFFQGSSITPHCVFSGVVHYYLLSTFWCHWSWLFDIIVCYHLFMIALDTCKYLTCHRQINYASFVEVVDFHSLQLPLLPQ